MEHLAGGVLDAYGADGTLKDELKLEYPEDDAESIYFVELPTVSVEESLTAAMGLKLRADPNQPELHGVAQLAHSGRAACGCDDDDKDEDPSKKLRRAVGGVMPITEWFPEITWDSFKADVVAGTTVATMVIPQSMSYAGIAGLSEVYGLYASTIPAIMYGIFGGSGQLAVGPVALVSLLVDAGLGQALPRGECPEYYDDASSGDDADTLADACPKEYARLVMVCMFFVGVIQLGGALCRLGFLINFLGHPVISGFTSGAAITIGLSQIKYWLGISLPKSQFVYETIGALYHGVFEKKEFKFMNFVLGIGSYGLLWTIKWLAQNRPKRFGNLKPISALLVCVISTALMIACPTLRDDYGVETIGKIPSGTPPFTLTELSADIPKYASRVLPTALSIALIGFMESIAIGKTLAAKHNVELPAGREMAAVGIANLVGAFFSGYPVAGSFSRSAISNSSGARTPLAGLTTGLLVTVFLVQLPKVIYQMPKFVLATIVISSVVNLFDIQEAKHLWKLKKQDFALWVIAFLGVLFLGVVTGLALAIGVSLAIVIGETSSPQIAVLWKLPGTSIYRNVKQGESLGHFVRGVLVLRVGASMYFANVAYIKDKFLQLAAEYADQLDGSVQYIVVEMTPVMTLDSTAIHMLEDLINDFKKRGIRVCLASISSRCEDSLRLAGVQRRVGFEWFHENVNSAVEWCVRHQAALKSLQGADASTPLVDPNPPSSNSMLIDEDDAVDIEGGGDDCCPGDVELKNGVRMRKSAKTADTKKPAVAKLTSRGKSDEQQIPVLMLASKHRVVDTQYKGSAFNALVQTPESRALEHIVQSSSSSLVDMANDDNLISMVKSASNSSLSTAEARAAIAAEDAANDSIRSLNMSDLEKRHVIQTLRRTIRSLDTVRQNDEAAALAPVLVVAIPDARASTLFLEVAVDIPDRPGLLRDITDGLLRSTQVTLVHSEAAVVNNRSLSIWRCEVPNRGAQYVLAAAKKAEQLLPKILQYNR